MVINRQHRDFHSISNVNVGLVFYVVPYEVNSRGARALYISIRDSFRRSRPVFADCSHAVLRITGFHGENIQCALRSIGDTGLFLPHMHLYSLKTTCVGSSPTPADWELFYNEVMRTAKST